MSGACSQVELGNQPPRHCCMLWLTCPLLQAGILGPKAFLRLLCQSCYIARSFFTYFPSVPFTLLFLDITLDKQLPWYLAEKPGKASAEHSTDLPVFYWAAHPPLALNHFGSTLLMFVPEVRFRLYDQGKLSFWSQLKGFQWEGISCEATWRCAPCREYQGPTAERRNGSLLGGPEQGKHGGLVQPGVHLV